MKHIIKAGNKIIKSWNSLLWLLPAALVMHSAQAQVTNIPVYEPFAYAENENLGATALSATNWSYGNSASSSSARIQAVANLAYPGMPGDANATPRGLRSNAAGKNRGMVFGNPVTNVTLYASFFLNLQTNATTTADRLFFVMSSSISGTTPAVNAGVWLDPSGRLKISKNSSSTPAAGTTYSLSTNTTYLVVLRYKVNTGGSSDDEVDLWLNPGPLGNNSNIPAPTLVTTNNSDAATQNGIAYMAATGTPVPLFYLDEIRVSTNWADVTPTNSIASGVYTVSGGGSGCAGDSFNINLSGSDSGIDYLLYTNGVASGLSVSGTGAPIAFSSQSTTAVYTVLATNTASGAVNWMSGSAAISVLTPPTITSQPAPVLAATNSTAVYSVSAEGSGLNYRWYRNGAPVTDGGHVSGAGTPLLVISPATTADQATTTAGYYCVITNQCGYMAISTTNALTLQQAGNLVWQGNPTNLWDIATTASWTNSAGTSVVFNEGDNVTLDDTFQNSVLKVNSPYVSPGIISYVGSQNMGISSSGNLIGSTGKLLASGTGTLSISNANSFAGGSTISNATVLVRNYAALGTGPINLAAGSLATSTLSIPITGSSSLGLNNDLNVVGDSVLQCDGTGSYSVVVFGALTGAFGATLTINHSGTGSDDRLRFYHTNFTCDANINLNGAYVRMTPYNSAGSQVYNGIISGAGNIMTRNSGGNIVLNNTNTYSGGTTLSLGGVGLGKDSAGDLSYGPFGTGSVTIDTTSGNSTLFAVGGIRSVGNPISYNTTTNTQTLVIGGTNQLTLSGSINLSSTVGDTTPTNRTIQVDNTAPTVLSGSLSDNSLGCGIIKTGNGVLYLDGANSYTGMTEVEGGRLAGSGSIAGSVIVDTNGVIGGGSVVTNGTLTITGNLTLQGGGFFRLNKSLAQSNDIVSVSGVLTNAGSGVIAVTNLGAAIVIGDSFQLFSQAVSNGAALTITGGGMNWTNKLAIDGSIQALSVASTIANYPTNISYTVSGSTLTITWPATHQGWLLQAQTNSLNAGLGTNWVTIPGTGSVTSTNLPVVPGNPSVFYRLKMP